MWTISSDRAAVQCGGSKSFISFGLFYETFAPNDTPQYVVCNSENNGDWRLSQIPMIFLLRIYVWGIVIFITSRDRESRCTLSCPRPVDVERQAKYRQENLRQSTIVYLCRTISIPRGHFPFKLMRNCDPIFINSSRYRN